MKYSLLTINYWYNRLKGCKWDLDEFHTNKRNSGTLDVVQTGLDVAGLVPVIGEFADGANAVLYIARGDMTNATLSAAAMIPIEGYVATGGKLVKKFTTVTILKEITPAIAKQLLKNEDELKLAAKTAKEALENKNSIAIVSRLKEAPPKIKATEAEATQLKELAACFTGTTPILTSTGYKAIKDIEVGDLVFVQNDQTGEKGFKAVKSIFENRSKTLMHIVVKNDTIDATANHKFLAKGKGWICAGNLDKGDVVVLANGSTAQVEDVQLEELQQPIPVYNFEVDDWHTYFVGQASVLVHNGCGADPIGGAGKAAGKANKRLIPGTPGIVTGGDSTKLGKNLMESMGLSRSTKWTGYQAQHLIPAEMKDNAVLKKIGMDLDDASNGIFLRINDADVSAISRHQGFHSVYNEVVKRALNRMDVSKSIEVLQGDVLNLQKKLKTLQEKGLPLYPKQGANVEMWERWLEKQ